MEVLVERKIRGGVAFSVRDQCLDFNKPQFVVRNCNGSNRDINSRSFSSPKHQGNATSAAKEIQGEALTKGINVLVDKPMPTKVVA